MESVHIQNKIKLLFDKIVQPNYVMDNYYADGLINKMANCSDPEISFLESIPLISDLIVDALDHIKFSHISVKVFLTRMLAPVAHKELHFAKIFAKRGDDILKDFNQINSPNMNPSLRVACMEVALALVQHNSGISWLLQTGVWKEILSLCNEKKTVFVVRQTYKFASKFLWKLNEFGDEANIKQVLGFILKPVLETDFLKLETITSEEEEEISKTVEPMLHMLISVVSEIDKIVKYSLVMNILLREYMVCTHLYIMFDRMRSENLVFLISKLIFWCVISKIFLLQPMTPGLVYSRDDFMELGVMYFNTIQYFIQRRCATLVLDFCNACNVIWTTVWQDKKPAMWEQDGRKIELQNQLLFMCLVPSLVYVKSVGRGMSMITDERVNEFIVNILNSTCEHTARAAYALRDLTLELDTLSITLQSVKRLSCLKNYLNNEQANLVFQALFYILKEYDPTDEHGEIKKEETFEESQEKVLVMTYVLDTVLNLVKNHNINWRDCLEVICLYSVVFNILKRPNLSCKFVVTALNVITVAVKKFLPPNLSLLLDATPGSAMLELGKLIYIKMHDLSWEIRDSALELLFVCTEISYIKFPPFQKQIAENNLINVAATMAFNDHEFYVQASALKCLGAATKVSHIWERLIMHHPNIQNQLISILRNNQEGIVRKEACNVLCDMYQNLKLNPYFTKTLYEHMASSALSDFHWEVQLSALKFWKIVIQSHLTDQGMLDGKFPPVTFSRGSRKIVTLNEAEIQKRLLKILNELASIGCLTAFVKLLNEDPEVEIMEAALSISLDFLDILDQYKVPEFVKHTNGEARTVSDLLCDIKDDSECNNCEDISEPETMLKSDTVIEGIINADDINLLANIYERHMNLKNDPDNLKPKVEITKGVSPYLFVTFIKSKNFKDIIEQKRKWKDGIKSFPSLLDDVLGIYEINNEVNSLDCY